ncbi:MAG: aldose 1-epimerase [Granulicella sp.]
MQRLLIPILAISLMLTMNCAAQQTQESKQPAASQTAATASPQVGGEAAVTLVRKATSGGQKPEFLSVTLLPGRGMNTFQITANIPGKGEIPLLNSPSLAEAAARLTLDGRDKFGNGSYTLGGAFLVPYPNRVLGTVSADGQTISTSWHGHTLVLPANAGGRNPQSKYAMHGLILGSKAVDLNLQQARDGQTETGTIHAGNFGDHWLSDTDLHFTVALAGQTVDVTITAKNVGKEAEPMAIGWHPYFLIPSGDRSQARLHVPAAKIAVANESIPTGVLTPVEGTVYDYRLPEGVPLGDHALDTNFSEFKRTDRAINVQIVDPKSHYGIEVQGLSPEIKTVQVYSPTNSHFVAVEDQFNFPDPFGEQWKGMDTGMVTLRPGQSVTWKVRLHLFTPDSKL